MAVRYYEKKTMQIGLPDALKPTFEFFPHALVWNILLNMTLRCRSISLWSLGRSWWTSTMATCLGLTPTTFPVMQSSTSFVLLSWNRTVDIDDFGFRAELQWLGADHVVTRVVTNLVKCVRTNTPNNKTPIKIPLHISFSRVVIKVYCNANATNTTQGKRFTGALWSTADC